MPSYLSFDVVVTPQHSGSRFDQAAADLFPDYSRSRIQSWIREGDLTVNGKTVKPNTKLAGGERLQLRAEIPGDQAWLAQDIALEVVFEDQDLIVLNKPSGLVVHPAAGNWDSTMLNGLIFRYPELREVPRAGIVHRLDKDTTGLMVVARNITSQTRLVEQLQARSVKRVYHAVSLGELVKEGEVTAPIGRHPSMRTKMAVVPHGGKPATTYYRPLRIFDGFTHLRLQLETGRTHQIRVHLSAIGYPLVGDAVYGRQFSKPQIKARPQLEQVQSFARQALHAKQLAFEHPRSAEMMEFETPLPEDFAALLRVLESNF